MDTKIKIFRDLFSLSLIPGLSSFRKKDPEPHPHRTQMSLILLHILLNRTTTFIQSRTKSPSLYHLFEEIRVGLYVISTREQ